MPNPAYFYAYFCFCTRKISFRGFSFTPVLFFFSADAPITVDKFCSLNYIKDDKATGVQLISHLATTDRSKDYRLSMPQGCSCCPSESSRHVLIALSASQSIAGGCDNLWSVDWQGQFYGLWKCRCVVIKSSMWLITTNWLFCFQILVHIMGLSVNFLLKKCRSHN